MRSKIYNGMTGILKMICAIIIGFLIGGFAIYDIVSSFPYLEASDVSELFQLLFLLFATLGYYAMFIRGFSQIKSLFKPDKADPANAAEIIFINVLSLPFIIAVGSIYTLYASIFDSDEILVITFFIYVLSIILMILDVIILLAKIKREKIKLFTDSNCMTVLNKISRAVVPMIVIVLAFIIRVTILDNLETMKTNESISNGFDSFVMNDFDGKEYTEELFEGHKVTMINIWGTFCHNCIEEMPELEEISRMYDEKDFQLIGLTGDLYGPGELDQGQVDLALSIIENTGVTYPILIPSKGLQAGVINDIHFYPTTIFFDEKGNVLKTIVGARSKEEWMKEIEEVFTDEERNR